MNFPSGAQAEGEPTSSPDTGKGHVLVVDDDQELLTEVSSALSMAGYRTRAAADAEAARTALVQEPRIAVLLTDIRMPGQSGIALAEALLDERHDRDAIEVVLMSGHTGEEDAVPDRVVGLLRKPFRLTQLTEIVGQAMARALARRRAVDSEARDSPGQQ